MSQDLNGDPLLRDLARLQPSSAGVDRDTMLFACGRASAPTGRGWKITVAALVCLQTATLGGWLSRSTQSQSGHGTAVIVEPQPLQFPPPESPGAPAVPAGSYGEMVRDLEHDGLPPLPAVADPLALRPTLSIVTSHHILDID